MADGQPSQVIYASGHLTVDGATVGLAREVLLEATYVRAPIEGEDRGGGIVDAVQSAWHVELFAEFRGFDNDLSQLIPAYSGESGGKLLTPRTVAFVADGAGTPSFTLANAVLGTDRMRMRFAPHVELVRAMSWQATHQDLGAILTLTTGS